MIEIKNNFLGSKMNKDIDDRLLPKNQYRHAVNLEINRSEGSDAGTVQNMLGNKEMKNFRTITNTSDLDCIGVFANPSTDTLFIFLTNNLDTSGTNTYNPSAKNFIYAYNSIQNNAILLVQGAFLNFSKNFKVLGINVLENFLFWTDNRNQPRKINITKAIGDSSYYTIEEQISVAKLSPLYPPNLYKASTIPAAAGKYETTMYNAASELLPTGESNPYYDDEYIGDAAYLEDKFVRFSYRYKFEDGEYSIIAPFTQIAYIPKQDGYFMYEGSGDNPIKDDETAAYRSTIVSFMENKVDQVKLQIGLPCPANELLSKFKITNIEILYKDANDIAVSAVDSIPVAPVSGSFFNSTATVYEYIYNSKKPFKTLPTKDLIRVNDIVPIRALCQEIISNRIVYSNYQNKASYPRYLDYNVGYGNKSPFVNNTSRTSRIEYPNHSVKENRNYQVGVVLADRFGRESGVILSSATSSIDANQFGASSLYVKYRDETSTVPAFYPGSALKVLFNSPITSGPEGWPGLYNGDKTSSSYNPLGWYSYKIVVKQTEQDYYNVYLPGFMASYPATPTLELGKTSHTVLINDNINKVPRDLTEVGPAQLQFRSSVTLYPRVENNTLAYDNQQFYPGNSYSFVNTIATNNSLFFPDNIFPTDPTLAAPYKKFYQYVSDPLIARISTPSELGVTSAGTVTNLAIAETKPFDSKLDIYWETSTTGLISELNSLIDQGTGGATQMTSSSFSLSEGAGGVRTAIASLTFRDELGNPIVLEESQLAITSVIDNIGTNLTSKFQIQSTGTPGQFRIATAGDGYFTYQSPIGKNQYTFNITSNSGVPNIESTYQIGNCTLTNAAPVISSPASGSTYTFDEDTGTVDVVQFVGENGSADSASNQVGLSWSIVSTSPNFSISSTGLLSANTNVLAPATYSVTVRLTDASGISGSLYVERSVSVTIADVITCSDFLLSGGTTGRSFEFKSCDGVQKYLSVGYGQSTTQCIELPFSATGATLSSTDCTTPVADCAVYEFQGGSSGRTFTNVYLCGETTSQSITVAPNTSVTRCIITPYVPTIQGAVFWGDCPTPGTCGYFELSGGLSGSGGHTFTFTECGDSSESTLFVEGGTQVSRCIELPFHDSNLADMVSATCPEPPLNCGYAVVGTQSAAVTTQTSYTGTISITGNQISVSAFAQGECEINGCTSGQSVLEIFENGVSVASVYSGMSSGGQLAVSGGEILPVGDYTYELTLTPIVIDNAPLGGGFTVYCPTGIMTITNNNALNGPIVITGVSVNGEPVALIGNETFPLGGQQAAMAQYALPSSTSSEIIVSFDGNETSLMATELSVNTPNPQIECDQSYAQAIFAAVDLTEEVSADIVLKLIGLQCS